MPNPEALLGDCLSNAPVCADVVSESGRLGREPQTRAPEANRASLNAAYPVFRTNSVPTPITLRYAIAQAS